MARISLCTSAMFLSTFGIVLLLIVSNSATGITEETVDDQQADESKRVRENTISFSDIYFFTIKFSPLLKFHDNFASFLISISQKKRIKILFAVNAIG